MKAIVLLLAILGVGPAILLSLWIVYISCSILPPQLEAQRFNLTRRIFFVQHVYGSESRFQTALWIPLAVMIVGIAFLVVLVFFLYGHVT